MEGVPERLSGVLTDVPAVEVERAPAVDARHELVGGVDRDAEPDAGLRGLSREGHRGPVPVRVDVEIGVEAVREAGEREEATRLREVAPGGGSLRVEAEGARRDELPRRRPSRDGPGLHQLREVDGEAEGASHADVSERAGVRGETDGEVREAARLRHDDAVSRIVTDFLDHRRGRVDHGRDLAAAQEPEAFRRAREAPEDDFLEEGGRVTGAGVPPEENPVRRLGDDPEWPGALEGLARPSAG